MTRRVLADGWNGHLGNGTFTWVVDDQRPFPRYPVSDGYG